MQNRRWRNVGLVVCIVLAGLTAGGCALGNLYAWMFAPRHPKETIKAAYPLESDRLVIVVYAGSDILFSDPTMPVEISRDLVNEILRTLPDKVKAIVHPVEVMRWQESNLEWPNMPLVEIAKTFKADTLLYLEIERYTLLEEQSANLLRGRVRAHLQVVKVGADRNPAFDTPIETVWPEDDPVGEEERSVQVVRNCTNFVFSHDVINKFHDYEVEVKGGSR